MFGKTMRIPDALLPRYARLAVWWPAAEVAALAADLDARPARRRWTRKSVSPRTWWRCTMGATRPGRRGSGSSARSSAARSRPRCRSCRWASGRSSTDLLLAAGFAESKRAAQRLIAEGGVKIDGVVVNDPAAKWSASGPAVLQVGSRKFVRVLP